MEQFEKRRDRFEFFDSFENPLLNITYRLETPDFITLCKEKGIPPFHFFLFCLHSALNDIPNFSYRILEGKVIEVEEIIGSYTVLNADKLFNFTRYHFRPSLPDFIQGSLEARKEAEDSRTLINTGNELPLAELKKYVFITSLPWLDFTSIQHPIYRFKSADIPSIAWGKFIPVGSQKIQMPFSVQAHHGFVDGFHMYELGEKISSEVHKNLLSFDI